jgi:phosphoribosylformylglycinamidine synthase
VFLLGETFEELGGSEYLKVVHNLEAGRPPRLHLDRERAVQEACRAAIRAGIVSSAHDCADGGLAVAAAECCVTTPKGWLGADLTLPGDMRPDASLFGESASRIVVSVRPGHAEELRTIAGRHGAPCAELGVVGGDHLALRGKRFAVRLPLEAIHWAWSTGLTRSLQ